MDSSRVNLDSKFQPNKHDKGYCCENDRISQLPDGILIDILSLLPLKQAGCTSVLSSRWMNLWKHTWCLDFDPKGGLRKIAKHHELLDVEREKYVEWVNHVLRSHKGGTLKRFRAFFDLSQTSSESITRWLEFALERHVQKLELHLEVHFIAKFMRGSPRVYYAFPEEFLTRTSAGASMSKSLSASDSSCIDFKSLKELSLQGVNLTDGTVESLLRMSPLLEKLVVDLKGEIWNLEVCGPSLVLKHLSICGGYTLKSLKISAPNLTTLSAPQVGNILLENVPRLVDVCLNCMDYPGSVKYMLPTLRCCISHLEILTLMLDDIQMESALSNVPKLPKLKKLDLTYMPKEESSSLMVLTPLIRASPCLQEFFLDVCWLKEPSRSHSEVRNTIQFPHHHLKMFEFFGYYGLPSDVELVKYISENSLVLEKIIVTTDGGSTVLDYAKQQLEALVPQNIKLAIY